jgi:transposase
MTRVEQRRKVKEREKLIKGMLREGKTCAEIGGVLGVTKQRVYDFLQQAKSRRALLNKLNLAREDRELSNKFPTTVNPGKKQNALLVLIELRELLIRSAYFSTTLESKGVRTVLIVVTMQRHYERDQAGIDSIDKVISKIRSSFLAASETMLIRRRENTPSGHLKRYTWVFTFAKK